MEDCFRAVFLLLESSEAAEARRGQQSLRLRLTFNKPGYSNVATADYSEAAGDKRREGGVHGGTGKWRHGE